MNLNYYSRIAFDSIRKNKQLYLPYLITCILMISIFYIINFLTVSDVVNSLNGSNVLIVILSLGLWVIIFFAVLLLFYSNSFLIRRRKKEFGLYSLLGLNQSNIIAIQFYENLIIAGTSLAIGITFGILLSKLFEVGLLNVIGGDLNYTFSVSIHSIIKTIVYFGVLFLLLFLNSIIQVNTKSIITLLRSENYGEKPPKSNWVLALTGLFSLGIGYFISVTIKSPLSAFTYFFIAVLFVIVGTYLILIAGSVTLCRLLQKNKKFYYKLNHFISVSSLIYRMKRNGAGLASICILSTTVLVIFCSTACLYIGAEDSLNRRYPKDENIRINFQTVDYLSKENINQVQSYIDQIVSEENTAILEPFEYIETSFLANEVNGSLYTDSRVFEELNLEEADNLLTVTLISLSEYNRLTGNNLTLSEDEVYIHNLRSNVDSKTITISDTLTFKVKGIIPDMFNSMDQLANMMPTLTIVVPNMINTVNELNIPVSEYSNFTFNYNFNVGINKERQTEFNKILDNALNNKEFRDRSGIIYSISENKEENRQSFFMLYGGLIYLGIILSIIFIFATVIIIYYKQISEGFEDQNRFKIMKEIGLTNSEIKKTINSQILTIFFIPLILAVINLAFAIPVINKILMIFNFNNFNLFLLTTVICIVIFSFFYILVYKITSNEYYKIVS